MGPDFYLDRRALAGYFEKDWFDHVLTQYKPPASFFEFPPFEPARLYHDSHERVADFVSEMVGNASVKPGRLLEVGSSLGRGFYEICRRTPSMRAATLVEPSQLLASTFDTLFRGEGVGGYPVTPRHGRGPDSRRHRTVRRRMDPSRRERCSVYAEAV